MLEITRLPVELCMIKYYMSLVFFSRLLLHRLMNVLIVNTRTLVHLEHF